MQKNIKIQMKSIEQIIKQIISEQIGKDVDTIYNDMIITKELGMDSLDMIELIMSVEDYFCIEIDDKIIETIKTVQDIIVYVKKTK